MEVFLLTRRFIAYPWMPAPTVPPPLSLYIHVPWCVRKCPYCDFNSHPARGDIPEHDYLAALRADLERDVTRVAGRTVSTVFLGGGTPSLLSAEAIESLLSAVHARLPVEPGAEVTLEANPGTVDQGRFRDLRAAGISRLSIGIQSFDNRQLRALGRIHGRHEALRAVESAHAAGFDNVNLDLMFGLPGQTVAQARADVETAVELAPTHVSYYQLTVEPNTRFHHAPPPLPDEDEIWKMQQTGQAVLSRHGFVQYEVSAYARPGAMCQHNLGYWQFGDYLGIGAGAHGKVTTIETAAVTRSWKVRHPSTYIRCSGTRAVLGGETTLSAAQKALEFMMNALRLTDGFPAALFTERTGLPISAIAEPLQQAQSERLLAYDGSRVRPTALGRRFLDALVALFVEAEA